LETGWHFVALRSSKPARNGSLDPAETFRTLHLLQAARTHLTFGGEIDVRRIGYGAMALTGLGGFGPPSDPGAARRLLRRAAELGVELFDTADSYGPDVSEELIAEALHPYPPEVVVATKGGSIREGPWQLRSDGRPEYLRTACEASLRRLRVDRIDLYQLHTVDPAVPLEESVGALADLRAAGKIGHIGLSNVRVEQLDAARRVVPIVSVQNEYNLLARGDQDRVVDYCEREGLAYLPWQPLAKGSLARTHGALGAVAGRHGVTAAEVALAWLLARSPAIVPIPGTLSLDHLERNIAALTLELTAVDLAELDSYEPSRLDARLLARRFVPPRMRRVVASVVGARRRLGRD
jgi:aryl-alcohol dehydrogenase-like predicted oxidoreductase